ncbi:cytochrome oxidase maturation protein, cbb3-type [Bradyrhizobium canariense]|uniref:Cytochrome oxidase maturation protein, cbb3-type n=1 Tax=Bradyrhizobium canariense TaxID=255045 RepID=A0ABX3X6E1_9BRAD|nr:cytochrome oxidase maturation protein, cbb3-type [Bradyrhizobium canariense]OSJ30577.1 cytochrome oxidase maturation protein, cbb3-type [Bradyrhizobium canariense]
MVLGIWLVFRRILSLLDPSRFLWSLKNGQYDDLEGAG